MGLYAKKKKKINNLKKQLRKKFKYEHEINSFSWPLGMK